jgi:hypothetical protein
MDWTPDESWFDSGPWQKIHLLSKVVKPTLGSPKLLLSMYRRIFPGSKTAGA